MAKWSGAATVAIRQKIRVITERIIKALNEKYGSYYKLGKGLHDDLKWLGLLNETSTRQGWTHPRDAIENMKEIIRGSYLELSSKHSANTRHKLSERKLPIEKEKILHEGRVTFYSI